MLIIQYLTKHIIFILLSFSNLLVENNGSVIPNLKERSYTKPIELEEHAKYPSSRKLEERYDFKGDGDHEITPNSENDKENLIIFHDSNKASSQTKCLFNIRTSECLYNITDTINSSKEPTKLIRRSSRGSLPYILKKRKIKMLENSPFRDPHLVPQPQLATQHLIDEIQYYVKYAGASYCKMFSTGDSQCSYCRDFDERRVVFPIENKTTSMHAIIVALPLRREIIIAYRGSDKTYKLINSISKETVEFPGVKKTKVHKYFYDSVVSLQKDIAKGLKYLLSLYPDSKIVLTGHSLGGGLATLAAPLIHRDLFMPYSRFRVITYGQLRIGNAEFANWYNELSINFTRVVNRYDEATDMPGFSNDWVHVKQEVHIVDNQYYICDSTRLEHPHCSFQKTWLLGLLTDHESVGNIGLSPRYCTNSFYFFKIKFIDF